jgi:GntR family transcriptional regulator, transcriptional repressor for pyruvate dehydrogenase complex
VAMKTPARARPVSPSRVSSAAAGGVATPRSSRLARSAPLPAQVVAALHRQITYGVLGPGERLPTEKKLCDMYGVSRAVIREAIGMLKHDGLVTSRQGSGAFVAERGAASAFRIYVQDLDDAEELRNVIELLVCVDVAVAEKAALRRSPQQLAAIKKALDAIEACAREGKDGVEEDMLFHRSIAAAAGNPFFVELTDFLDARVRKFIRTARTNTARQRGLSNVVQGEHAAIFAAIQARDPVRAREAAEHHLQQAAQRLQLYRAV